jgi:cation transport protein ChaC
MSFDTIDENRNRQILQEYDEIWLFGYGSLIYKVDFPYLKKRPASIKGWKRRFWQGSHDHRGTPESPGRVVTLIEEDGQSCQGIAYQVTADVFEHLDHREKNGYLRYEIEIALSTESEPQNKQKLDIKRGLVYIAPTTNAAYLGAASEEEIAEYIYKSSGPSGANKEYVFLLANALRNMNEDDEHVFKIEKFLKELET